MPKQYVLTRLPEQEEGKESDVACLVLSGSIKKVKKIVLGQGLGVQGYDYGIGFSLTTEKISKNGTWIIPVLTIEQLKLAVATKELCWGRIIGWQRWGFLAGENAPMVDEETKTIIVKRDFHLEGISACFAMCGWKIEKRS